MAKDKTALRADEVKIISADLVAMTKFRDTEYGGAAGLIFSQLAGGSVIVAVPSGMISDVAIAALSLARVATEPTTSGGQGPSAMEAARGIQADRLSALDPARANAPAGHAVLRIHVGEASFDFSAPLAEWRAALERMSARAGTVQ